MKSFYFIIFIILSSVTIAGTHSGSNNRALSKDLTPIPTNINPDVNLKINIENKKDSYKVGEYISFQVSADKDGYITLWDIGTSGHISRIFPNKYSKNNLYVKAGSKSSIGGDSTDFTFKVTGKSGNNGVFAIWSERIEDQPSSSDFESSLSMSKDLIPLERKRGKSWATDNIKFEIQGIDDDENLFSNYQFNHSGKVYILAMGADTAGLQKANDDAELFSQKMSEMFSASQVNIDLKTNVTRDEFIDGLEELSEIVTPQDIVIIYFSGHGSLVKDDNNDESKGKNKGKTGNDAVFVTYGAEREGLTTDVIVRDDEFASLVNNINTNNIISFIDACHAGGMQRDLLSNKIKYFPWGYKDLSLAPLTTTNANPEPLPIIDSVKGLVLAAAKESDNAIELFNGGYFTYTFLKELYKAKDDNNLFSIFENTKNIVEKETHASQTPIAVGDSNIAKRLRLIRKRGLL